MNDNNSLTNNNINDINNNLNLDPFNQDLIIYSSKSLKFSKEFNEVIIELNSIEVINYIRMINFDKTKNLDLSKFKISYSLDNVNYFNTNSCLTINRNDNDEIIDIYFYLDNLVVKYLKLELNKEYLINNSDYLEPLILLEIDIYKGNDGYIGKENKEYNSLFKKEIYWTGGDGLYSFNLDSSNAYKDSYLNNKEYVSSKTLMVFGDTFLTTFNKSNKNRLDPILMPNNSYSILEFKNKEELIAKYGLDEGNSSNNTNTNEESIREELEKELTTNPNNISFHINEDDKGHIISYIEPDNYLSYEGSMASNLIKYNGYSVEELSNDIGYLSGFNPKENIILDFIFNSKTYISFINILNYNYQNKRIYEKRSVKELNIYIDNKFFKKVTLKKGVINRIDVKKEVYKNIRFEIPNVISKGNYGGANNNEPLYGLKKVYFYIDEDNYLIDLKVKTNSELFKKSKSSWFWLQDGVIINDYFYSLPLVVSSDLTQKEGFQFKVEGIAMIKCPLVNGEVIFNKLTQKGTNLLRRNLLDHSEIILGGAIYKDSESGYIYIYGYMSKLLEPKKLVVSRVKEDDFEDINKWEYFNGEIFTSSIDELKPLIEHISCEFSISKDNDKYILVFTKDVQSRYIAYSISDTPYGPFKEERIAYLCKENLCPHMYIYNAKAHPHLSKPNNLLVSYNINTSNFDENIFYGETYGPRFINLIHTSKLEGYSNNNSNNNLNNFNNKKEEK